MIFRQSRSSGCYVPAIVLAASVGAFPIAAQTPLPPPSLPGAPQNSQQPAPDDSPLRPRRPRGGANLYNGDFTAGSIDPFFDIDDPVTGFGNEALWADPPGLTEILGDSADRTNSPD